MTDRILLAILASAVICAACSENETTVDPALWQDRYSFANTGDFITSHLHLDLAVDFATEELHGSATLNIRRLNADATQVILDTRDLTITSASFIDDSGISIEAAHELGETDELLGTPLTISIPNKLANSEELTITLEYRTSPESTALGWLGRTLDHPGNERQPPTSGDEDDRRAGQRRQEIRLDSSAG